MTDLRRVDERAHGRRIEDDVLEGLAQGLHEATEALGRDDVRRVGDMRLGVEEVEVLLAGLDDRLLDGHLLGKDRIEPSARAGADHVRKGAAAHVALDEDHVLAARRDGLGKVERYGGLALVGRRRREGDDADGVVDAGEADVRQQGLGGVLDNELVGAGLLLRHITYRPS